MKHYGWKFILLILISFITACTPQPTQEVPQEFEKGQEYFHRVCSNCHGSDAMGRHTKAPGLIDTDYIEKEFSDDDFREAVLEGTDKMPPQKNNVKAEEVTEIIKYLRYSQQAANMVTEEDVADEEDEEPEGEKEGA